MQAIENVSIDYELPICHAWGKIIYKMWNLPDNSEAISAMALINLIKDKFSPSQ